MLASSMALGVNVALVERGRLPPHIFRVGVRILLLRNTIHSQHTQCFERPKSINETESETENTAYLAVSYHVTRRRRVVFFLA